MQLYFYRDKDCHPAYHHLVDVCVLVSLHTPVMKCISTATNSIIKEVVLTLEMWEFVTVCLSLDQRNILYEVKTRAEPETDFSDPLSIPREKLVSTPRVICLLPNCDDVCSFVCSLQLWNFNDRYYHPPPHPCGNRLLGMFNASTPKHSIDVIMQTLMGPCGVVRIVCKGMGVDLHEQTSFILANLELSLAFAVSGDTPTSLLITFVRFKGPCNGCVLMALWTSFLKAWRSAGAFPKTPKDVYTFCTHWKEDQSFPLAQTAKQWC